MRGADLENGKISSCGCTNTHALYRVWYGMKSRCYNKNFTDFKNYGGRGIRVCDRWRRNFNAFIEDMGERPEGTTLDRIDNNGDYEPANCKWSTYREQNMNMRKRKGTSSQYRGVCWCKASRNWRAAYRNKNGKSTYLGTFKNEKIAAVAYNVASWNEYQDGRFLNEVII